MNVLIVHGYIVRCGPHYVATLLVGALTASGHHVVAAVPEQNEIAADLKKAGATVRLIPTLRSQGRSYSPRVLTKVASDTWAAAAAVARLVREYRIQVVHTSTVACLAGLVGARIAGSASVVHLHDLTLWRPRALGFLYGLVLAISADTIVAVSEAAKRAVLPTRLARKVAVVHNAVDLERFGENPEERERARAALGAKPSEFLVGCVGNLDYRKGQDLLADVAVLLQRFGNEFRFVVIGGVSPSAVATGFAEQFGQQIDGLSVRRHFTFLGQREDVPSLLTACDALIQPSRFDAGPVAVLEAMACRLPVVATNVGGNREEVSDNVTGLIVPSEDPAAMADALHSLWADPLRRNRMGQAGRRQVERTFGCRKQLEHILAIYRTAVQRRPGRVNRPCDQVLPS